MYKEKQFPKSRIGTLDVFAIGLKKHHVKALIEVDVTLARERIRQEEQISFTAWLAKAISKAVADFEDVHAFLKNKRTRLVFDDIDITVMVERNMEEIFSRSQFYSIMTWWMEWLWPGLLPGWQPISKRAMD